MPLEGAQEEQVSVSISTDTLHFIPKFQNDFLQLPRPEKYLQWQKWQKRSSVVKSLGRH